METEYPNLIEPESFAVPTRAVHIDGGHFNNVGRDQHNIFHNSFHTHQTINLSTPSLTTSPTLQDVLVWLATKNFRATLQEQLLKRTLGSGRWLLKDRRFRRWLKSRYGLFWAVGMPGAGKTVIASIIIEYLQTAYWRELAGKVAAHEILVCFAYFRYTEPMSLNEILATLVRQALERAEHVLPTIDNPHIRLYTRHRMEGTRPSVEELVDILIKILKCFKLAFIVLDGLDEVQEDIRHRLCRILLPLDVYLVIASRPLPHLEATLTDFERVEIIASDDDIESLVMQTIEQNPVFRTLLETERTLKGHLVSSIKQNSNGMFLHASLQLKRIEQCRTIGDVRDELSRVPPGMDAFYADTLNRIMRAPELDAYRGKTILMWLVFSVRPVSLADLQVALAMDEHGVTRRDIVIYQETLVSLCHSLVTVDSEAQQVCLAHPTAKIVLERHLLEADLRPYASLSSACIARLRARGFCDFSMDTPGKLKEMLNAVRFLDHAYAAWAYYARRCDTSDTVAQETIHKFLLSCVSYPKKIVMSGALDTVELFTGMHLAAWCNLPHQVSMLVAKGVDMTKESLVGRWTPLMAAAYHGYSNIVGELLAAARAGGKSVSAYVNAVNSAGQDALVLALSNGHCETADILFQTAGYQIHVGSLGAYRAALRHAAWQGRIEVVEFILQISGMRVNGLSRTGSTALAHAARQGHLAIVEALLRHPNIAVNWVDNEGKGPLIHAVEAGKLEVVEALLCAPGILVNAKDHEGKTALMAAANLGYWDSLNALLAAPGVDVNAVDLSGHTALMYATEGGRLDIVEALLRVKGIQPELKSKSGNTLTSRKIIREVAQLLRGRNT